MSGIQQKIRQPSSQQTEQKSLLQTGTWSKVFPKQHNTETKSCTFVKKLIAVAISNITYLRSIFPEKVFSNRTLDGLPLKILKEDAGCEAATNLVGWLRGAFEALEKRYLRELMLVLYLDPENPDKVHEMYTFRFGYSGEDRAECQLLQGTEKKLVNTVTDDDLYKATQTLLRTVIVLVQGLGILPDSAFMTMKLTYYDEVTPKDYEPPGFRPTELISPQFPTGAVRMNSGEVSTNFHTLKLKVKAVPVKLLVTASQEAGDKTAAITNSFSVSESEPDERRKEVKPQDSCSITDGSMDLSKNKPLSQDKSEIKTNLSVTSTVKESLVTSNTDAVEAAHESVSLLSGETEPEEIPKNSMVKCICKNEHLDNIMMPCTVCQTIQHGACYRIIFQSDIPEKHICVQCSLKDTQLVCTDRKLAKMAFKGAVATTCTFRRALACILNVNSISASYLIETLGITEEYAEGLIEKFVSDEIVTISPSGEYYVNSEILRTSSLPSYLGIKRYIQKSTEQEYQTINQIKDTKKEEKTDAMVRENKRRLQTDNEQLKDVKPEKCPSRRSKRSKVKASIVENAEQLDLI